MQEVGSEGGEGGRREGGGKEAIEGRRAKEGRGGREGRQEEKEEEKAGHFKNVFRAFRKHLRSFNNTSAGIYAAPGSARRVRVSCNPRENPVI